MNEIELTLQMIQAEIDIVHLKAAVIGQILRVYWDRR